MLQGFLSNCASVVTSSLPVSRAFQIITFYPFTKQVRRLFKLHIVCEKPLGRHLASLQQCSTFAVAAELVQRIAHLTIDTCCVLH